MGSSLGHILIVDDEPSTLELLDEYLTTQGYTVQTVLDGPTALAAIGRERPDLILLDIRLPGMDGVEALRRIRAIDATVPVIMATANADAAVACETLQIGAFDYIAKPFDFAYLDRVVAASLKRSRGGPPRPAREV